MPLAPLSHVPLVYFIARCIGKSRLQSGAGDPAAPFPHLLVPFRLRLVRCGRLHDLESLFFKFVSSVAMASL